MHSPHTRGQSSPANLQSGQQPWNGNLKTKMMMSNSTLQKSLWIDFSGMVVDYGQDAQISHKPFV